MTQGSDGARAYGSTDGKHESPVTVDQNTAHDTSHDVQGIRDRDPRTEVEQRVSVRPAKTSPVAVFALVFGLSALILVLTVLLSPVGLVLSIIGLILGFIALKTTKKVGVTGRGVAIGGLVLSILALLLAITLAVGAVTFLNNQGAVDRLEEQVQNLRDKLPTQVEIPQP